MNIRKGDWVQVKHWPSMQGRVEKIEFIAGGGYHDVTIRVRGLGYGGRPQFLRVIRRTK